MSSSGWRTALSAARGAFLLGAGVWCCSLYEGRTLEFFDELDTPGAECRNDDDCPRDRHCADHVCRECLVDSDCGGPKHACVGNVCVECGPSGDYCPMGQSCNPALLTCAPGCGDPTECVGQPNSYCSSELDLCVQCLENDHCLEPRNPFCGMGGRCVECVDSDQCDGRVCDPKDNRCVECLADADCGEGTCDVGRHRCRQPCAGSIECNEPKRPACDSASGSCVECNTSDDCKGRRPACGVEHQCVECLTNADCIDPGKPACLVGMQRCGQCTGPEHCAEGERCDPMAARCVPAPPAPGVMEPGPVDPAPVDPAPADPPPDEPPDPSPGPDGADAGRPPPPGPGP